MINSKNQWLEYRNYLLHFHSTEVLKRKSLKVQISLTVKAEDTMSTKY